MARFSSTTRITRLLAVIPFVAAQRGGVALSEVSERFAYPIDHLVEDLGIVQMVGVPPYSPDTMVEVTIDDDWVWIKYADFFNRPMRLSAEEGLALMTAGRALLAADVADDADDADTTDALTRALTKLGNALGEAGALEINLASSNDTALGLLREAATAGQQVRIDYYSYGTDRRGWRTIDPKRVFSAEGVWYVAGYCHLAGDERVFRVDRIASAELLDATFTQTRLSAALPLADPGVDLPRVSIEVAPAARWVAEQYPHTSVTQLADAWTAITLPIAATAWLERLLLRLGSDARIGRDLEAVRGTAARRVLARYGSSNGD